MSSLLSCLAPLFPVKRRSDQGGDDEGDLFSEKAGLVRPSAGGASSDKPLPAKVDTTGRVGRLREVMMKEGLGA